jgi:hypothetical protein
LWQGQSIGKSLLSTLELEVMQWLVSIHFERYQPNFVAALRNGLLRCFSKINAATDKASRSTEHSLRSENGGSGVRISLVVEPHRILLG